MTANEMHEYLHNASIATEDELKLISQINGHNEQTYEDVLYARTGLQSFDQL